MVTKSKVFGRFSKFMLAAFGALVIGAGFIVLEAYRSGYVFLAMGTPFIALVLLVSLYKSHTAAAESKKLRLELKSSLRSLEREIRQTSPSVYQPNNNGQKKLIKSVDRLENQQRLRKIGLFAPKKLDTRAKGRQAAAVAEDPKRSYRLYAATRGTLSSAIEPEPYMRKVAVVASQSLKKHLQDSFHVISLHPGLAEAQFEAENPSCLIIEEAALQDGPWSTALSATGTALFQEILGVRNRAAANGLQIYVLPSNLIEVSTRVLRSRASVLVDYEYGQEFIATQHNSPKDKITPGVISSLVAYRRDHSKAAQ